MQISDLESFSFFQNIDGSVDSVASALNCFESSVYNVIKNSNSFEKDILVPLFIRDINPTLWYNDTSGIFRLYNQSRNLTPLWRKYIKVNHEIKKRDNNSIQFLESLLDKGQMVIIQTVFEKIRFLSWYDPNYDFSIFSEAEDHHVNIIVYHEEDKIYYVEKLPYNINKENFVPYELNKQIGVSLKSDMEEACNFFLRCYTLEINEEELKKTTPFNTNVINFIHAVADNYSGGVEQVGGYTRCYGTAALEKLIKFCDEGVDLNKYFITTNWTLQNRICFDIWMLHGSRQILLEYFKLKNSMECSREHKLLIEILHEAIVQWETLERAMSKLTRSSQTQLNPKIGKRIESISEVESRLNAMLRKL